MHNRFLQKAQTGNAQPQHYAVAVLLTWIGWMFIGALPFTYFILERVPASQAEQLLNDLGALSDYGISSNTVFLFIMLQFVIGLGAVYYGTVRVLKRPFLSAISGFAQYRWKKTAKAAGLWTLLLLAYTGIQYLMAPESFSVQFDAAKFFPFLLLALPLIPIQSAFEEIAVRGQLLQGISSLTPRLPWVPLLLSSLVFGLLHISNPEVSAYGTGIMMVYYCSFGLFLALLAILDEGLELSIGIHAVNNLFSFLVISYPDMALDSPSILLQNHLDPYSEVWFMLGSVIIATLILIPKTGQKIKALFTPTTST